jgi:hypothetical protein
LETVVIAHRSWTSVCQSYRDSSSENGGWQATGRGPNRLLAENRWMTTIFRDFPFGVEPPGAIGYILDTCPVKR